MSLRKQNVTNQNPVLRKTSPTHLQPKPYYNKLTIFRLAAASTTGAPVPYFYFTFTACLFEAPVVKQTVVDRFGWKFRNVSVVHPLQQRCYTVNPLPPYCLIYRGFNVFHLSTLCALFPLALCILLSSYIMLML